MDSHRPVSSVRSARWMAGLMVLLVPAAPLYAATFYVRAGGDDTADGRTPASAFASIRTAADALVNAGDQVVVGPGTYPEGDISPARNGIPSRPIVFYADTDGRLTGDEPGPVVVAPPPTVGTGFLVLGRHDIVINGFTIVGALDAGIQVRRDRGRGIDSSGVVIINNTLGNGHKRGLDVSVAGYARIMGNVAHDNGSSGITVEGEPGTNAIVEVSDNTVTANREQGLVVAGVTQGLIDGNRIEDNGNTGLQIRGTSNVTVTGNVIGVSGGAGIQIGRDQESGYGSADVSLSNNTVSESAGRGIDVLAAGAVQITGNTARDNGSSGITVQGEPDSTTTVELSSNVVTANAAQGMVLHAVRGGTIDGNHIDESGDTGIQIRESFNLTLSNNTLTNSRAGGIAIGTAFMEDPGDCDSNGEVTVDELLVGVNIVLDLQPLSMCPAFDARGDGEVTVAILIRAINAALGVPAPAIGTDYVIAGNRVLGSDSFGIDINAAGQITVQENLVLRAGSGGGLSIRLAGGTATTTVTGNTLGLAGVSGLFLSGASRGTVQNNVIFSNGDTGITVRASSDVQVANNLVYANAGHGIAIGTGSKAAPRPTVVNNTVYKNGGWGLAIGNAELASPDALVANNIFNLNAGGGVTTTQDSFASGYVAGFNLNTDGYGSNTRRSPYEFSATPLFVNPEGPDGVLGGDAYEDDDFRLRSDSPAAAAGSGAASEIGITGAAVEGTVEDTGVVSLGYHYDAAVDQQISIALPDLFMPLYVRADGDPANDGLAPERALRSIRDAGLRATSATTIIVGPGTYREGDIRVRNFARYIAFLADPTGVWTGEVPGPVLVDARDTGADTGFVVVDGPGTVIDGFHVTGGVDAGIQVRRGSDGSQVRNNVVFSNARRGIDAINANTVQIVNNLVYANGTGGLRVAESEHSVVMNNTSYGNGTDPVLGVEANGILIGGGTGLEPTRGTVVRRNVVQGNPVGILVTDSAFEGYVTGFNVCLDGFPGHTPRADSDFIADALFVDPAGPDGILGGAGFADDDFRLVQDDDLMSPAVDIDYLDIDVLLHGTTRMDGAPDTGPADAGYHYPLG